MLFADFLQKTATPLDDRQKIARGAAGKLYAEPALAEACLR